MAIGIGESGFKELKRKRRVSRGRSGCLIFNASVVDDFGYVCLDKGKRRLVNVVEVSKHNAETSHVQHPKQ